jgi:UDP-glucose 4-epimerase
MSSQPTVLITGGAGFIGSHVTAVFLQAGWRILVLDTLATGKRENLPSDEKVELIVRSALSLEDFTPTPLPQVVIHLAAVASVDQSWQSQRECHDANLTATIAVMEFCRRYRIPRLVFASSAAVYGPDPELPVREESPGRPISPYGLQKWVSEEYGRLFAPRDGYTMAALRLFNVFGPRQAPDSPYSGVISRFLKAFLNHEEITVFGDGLQTRDFVYVKDVAQAFFLAATRPLPSGTCWVGNVGTGQARSLLDLLEVMRQEFPHWQGRINHTTSRPGDIRHSVCDNSHLRQTLGWSPAWSFERGMQDYIKAST